MDQEMIISLKRELAKYKAIALGSPDVILMTDGKEGNILEVSPSCTPILGYKPEDLVGKKFDILFEKEASNSPEDDNEIRMFDLVHSRYVKKADGSFIPMDLFVTVDDLNGQKVVLTNFRDVTERVEAENQIRRMNEELKNLNRTKDKFFSIIAHDLKSPFAGLLMLFDMLLDQDINVPEADKLKMLGRLRDSSKAVFTLIQNLLEWSLLNMNSVKINPEKINIKSIAAEMISLLTPVAENKNIGLVNEIGDDFYGYIDLNSIKTVVRNLISNSLKFTPRGGSITLRAKKQDNEIIISIIDTGVGMTQEQMEKAFIAGGNRSTKGTDNEKGTGLGLVLCHELMVKNNAKISVESKLSKGTTFTLILPEFLEEKSNFS
ncbi:MAG TPA: PAS domain-containing sensor histidine kinase [Ignavibacteriaceae bacterium]|nr:PAS domain-containing sensor histidine kinase [Ignavibacteriaceae bacterium]HPO54908.1 PAS domain-containing sensor histidine kinase [Ignavibacteriaceae bacterium]